MEDFILLQEEQLAEFAHMIPKWLLESPKEGTAISFWGAFCSGIPCGAAVIEEESDRWTLRYVYILEEFRGSGRGTHFLQEMMYAAYLAKKQKFQVRYIPEQNPALKKVLNGYAFFKEEEMLGSFSCTLGELSALATLQGGYGSVKPLSECTQESLAAFYREIGMRGTDLVELPLKKERYLADCCAAVIENGRTAGLLLVKEERDGTISIPYLINLSQNIAAPVQMIRFALQRGSRQYPPETVCRFAVISETLFRLLRKLGVTFVQKRQRLTMDLSYFAQYEQEAEKDIDRIALGI